VAEEWSGEAGLQSQVTDAQSTADANTAGISTNVAGISTNAAGISTNTAGISTNTTGISTNATAISTNAAEIFTNATAISTNAAGISTNAAGISTNAAGIASNDTAIAATVDQSAEIAALQAQVVSFQTYLASLCGNGEIEVGIETCDDGNTTDDANGCSSACQTNGSCGNGLVETLSETCDDGGIVGGDGCNSSCEVEIGWNCVGEPSACSSQAARFIACADGLTVADQHTGLLWEKKTGTYAPPIIRCKPGYQVCPNPNDVNNRYTWSGSGSDPDGTVFSDFLAKLNSAQGLAGYADWRVPSFFELQSILVGPVVSVTALADPLAGTNPTGQATTCVQEPCVAAELSAVGGPFASSLYWSMTTRVCADPGGNCETNAYTAPFFLFGNVQFVTKTLDTHVLAVRTGSCTD
jgi:cysteine-rich repeat protein